jgi:hypothetical protein
MQRRRIIVSLVATVAAAQFSHGSSHDVQAEIFGGQRNFDAFMSTHFFTMERLHAVPTDSENPYPREPDNLSSYRRQNPVRLSSEQIKELKNLLTRPSSYEWDSTKACLPNYGVLLTVHSNPEIRIALCFECDMLAVYVGHNTAKQVNAEDDFDSISQRLLAIAQVVYPKDSELAKAHEPSR